MLLTPSTTECLGYEVAAIEAEHPAKFLQSLLQRMGKGESMGKGERGPEERDDHGASEGGAEVRAPPARRRTTAAAAAAPRPSAAPVRSAATPRPVPVINTTSRLTFPPRPSPISGTPAASRLRTAAVPQQVASPYFAPNGHESSAATGSASSTRKRPRAPQPRVSEAYTVDDEDDEYNESFFQHLEQAEALASGSPAPARVGVGKPQAQTGRVDYDEIDGDGDDDWFAEVDIDQLSAPQSRGGGSGSTRRNIPPHAEVIEISD